MAEPFVQRLKGTSIPGLVIGGCRFSTSTSGTISTTFDSWGCAVAKTAAKTGRYTITLARNAVKLVGALVTIVGPDDAALTTTKGLLAVVRDNDVDPVAMVAGSALDGTFEVQLTQTNAGNADTEVQDAALVYIVFFLVDTTIG